MASDKINVFTIWPIFTCTKSEKKINERMKCKHLLFGLSRKGKKIKNSDVKTKPPVDIKWSAQ